jgi:biotin carboxyl carrier protein
MCEIPVLAPLVGTISQQLTEDGAEVSEGDAVVEIEAMKMMFSVEAPAAGTVRYRAALGAVVGQDEVIAVIEQQGD